MRTRRLGSSDLEVSVVGCGTWATGADFWGAVDDQQSIRAIQAAIDHGINLIDTAPAYGAGHAETMVGKAIAGRRDEVVVATKVGIVRRDGQFIRNLKPESVRREVDDSLHRLGVDTIDLYQIHWPDSATPIEDTLAELKRINEAGKFRYLGVSNFKPALMDAVRREFELVSLQPPYSLLNRKIESHLLPYCREHGIGTLGYGSLAGGVLTGKFGQIPQFAPGDERSRFYDFFREPLWTPIQQLLDTLRGIAAQRNRPVAQVAINWALRDGGVTCALVGARNADQASGNAGAGEWELTPDELGLIDKAYKQHVAPVI
ncbi:MAG: aldo/keto reductase [Spirochaetaceae bacterium]|nr:MAG: aldo/keto reductase [Spirochaetaceae bacterium]